jgi:type IV secretion system protein VirD4
MREHDILLGRHQDGSYIRFGGGEPVAVHARTGSGKSADFGIPNCFTWQGSLVVLDIKGEAFRATAGHRAAMGQDVYLLEPASKVGRSHRWDPFAAVARRSLDRFRQIARMGSLQFPEIDQIGGGANNNKFWDDCGRQSFKAVATIIAESPYERLTMERIAGIFNRADGHYWLAEKIDGRRSTDEPYSQIAVDGISDYIGDDPKLRADIRKTVSTRLQIWSDPQLAAVTTGSDFDLRDLRRKPMTIYVVVAPGDIEWLRPLLRLFFDQLINLNTDATPKQDPSLRHQVLVMLDEFVRLGRMDSLAHAAQYTRDYGLRIAYIVQNKAQVNSIYGPNGAADIFGNLGAEIVFGTNDSEVTRDLETRLGDNTVMFTTRNRPRFWSWINLAKQGESDHPHRRPLMLDQEVARMSPDEQLIIRAGMKPMKTNRARWFTDPEFTTRVRPPPEIPKLDISIAFDDGETLIPDRRNPSMTLGHRP